MLRRSPKLSLALLALVAAIPLAALRVAPAQPPSPSASDDYVTYDAGFSRWLNAPKTVEMSQGVTFSQDDAFLKTDAAVVNLDSEQRALNARSQAPVHLYDSQNDLTGQHGFIDFTRHLATLTDNITLIVKPGPQNTKASSKSLRSQFKDAATMTCTLMTYDYRRKQGRVPGPLTIHQKDRVLTADSGEYDGRAQTVKLIGNVHGRNGDGDIQASQVVVNIKEGNESITIPVPTHGRWRVKKQDETDTSDAQPPAPTQSPPARSTDAPIMPLPVSPAPAPAKS